MPRSQVTRSQSASDGYTQTRTHQQDARWGMRVGRDAFMACLTTIVPINKAEPSRFADATEPAPRATIWL